MQDGVEARQAVLVEVVVRHGGRLHMELRRLQVAEDDLGGQVVLEGGRGAAVGPV